ncbi:calmodulin-regulated spectrin-associated protein 3 isoform X3 [Ictalurus punctatus]|uniref:Calmodulin-regulated spectrin-associated protein 3 isoform X3 n=1 Tax=Ictalurus punctatus TaxID=7998 RepID=A0A9F7QRM5_ICTPU|nr:calmodulin-regulated spectrin-associated protein 3 isoform X3 [Ictalurus punctatus]
MVDSNAMRKTFVVPDVKPLDQYDINRAKICASVGWLLAKSYGNADSVPAELRDPFYLDQYEQEHLKPPVTRLLQSPELYCRTYGLLLAGGPGANGTPTDNTVLLQTLSKKGLTPRDQNTPVTEADLRHKPIKMSAHLAVMDALMAVGAMETVRASGGVERLGGEDDWERTLLHWVNTLNKKLKERTESDQTQQSTEPQPVQASLRYRKDKLLSKLKPCFPVVNEVKDLSNGCAIAAVIHYYCPGLLRLEDVCMKESMSLADSLYNLQLILEFCESCLKSCCPLVLEDMLYSPPELQVNMLSFLAELLYWFEVSKPDFVQPLNATESSGGSENGNRGSGSSSPSLFKKPFLPISPATPIPGSLTQSTSMSHVEAAGRSWTKNPLSIPFGLDSDVDIVMGNPVIMRSVSSDNINPAGQPGKRAHYTPPEDISRSPGPNGPQRASWASRSPAVPLLAEENGLDEGDAAELPTIEEALQIIHNEGKMEPRLHPDGAPDGFYLHSPDDPASRRHNGSPAILGGSAPSGAGMQYRPMGNASCTRRTSDGSRDDDSVLRDGSVDSDASEDLPKTQSTPATPAGGARVANSSGQETPDSGVKMTSFAERKKKLAQEQPIPDEDPQMTSWAAKKTQESPSKSPALTSEMSELGARLEEKRKAIEAQKRRIEAIFAKHRQRLGKSAFLQLKKEQEEDVEGVSAEEDVRRMSLDERLARMEKDEESDAKQEKERPPDDRKFQTSAQQASKDKTVAGPSGEKTGVPLGDYNNAVSKLNAALSSLQNDVQRLSEQQNQLLLKKIPSANQTWVIPPSTKSSAAAAPPRLSRESTRDLIPNSSSSSPSPSRRISSQAIPPKSPGSHRRAQSAPPKSPKNQHHSRSADPKMPTLTRVITAPHCVDSMPHRRKVSPWHYRDQTSSSFSFGSSVSQSDSRPPSRPLSEDTSDDQTVFSLELDGGSNHFPGRREHHGGSSSGAPSECSFESDIPASAFTRKPSSLIEIPLSSLSGLDREDAEHGLDAASDSMSDHTEPETKTGIGFFFKQDEARPEDEMAQRRAALLEKQQKRAEEIKRKRQEQEREKEASRRNSVDELERPRTPSTPPPARTPPAAHTPPPDGSQHRRGTFTRQEYEWRHQLKIMEDLDKALRQKPTTVRGVKKQRPKTVFRDDSDLSRSPAKGLLGSRLNKVYSHSTMNLSSMANDTGTLTIKKSPSRSHSPSRLMSPGRMATQNGDKDWENASTLSSPASIPEYTGPKLYKEPSFKSNKFIIHNAISRCCLAGKVNEPQKNKIIEEMEKSSANHFLILFRDSSCQFRAVYTMNPETEELVRLTGIGPRIISLSMVESIYKYSSDRKQFSVIPSKTMSMSVDAFTIPGQLWQTKRPGTPKKLGTPK